MQLYGEDCVLSVKIFKAMCKVFPTICHNIKMYGGVKANLRALLLYAHDGHVVGLTILPP
jgi:hypothetical protein